ncbi:unnamed protein product [Durusdinium trenchii]|uniref:Uncharacterized protein n=1 Tax=Durusdinium trenchii TaxID=1381693 RepID=A0ABP0L9J7_9DINO
MVRLTIAYDKSILIGKKKWNDDWDKLKYWERFKHVEDYEEQYMYVDAERAKQQDWPSHSKGHAAELLHHLPPGAKWDTAVKGLTKKMYRNIDKSFEDYLENKKNLGTAEEEYERHYNNYATQEKAWAERASAEVLDSEEEQELQEARDRMAQQRWERLNKEKKAWLEALDDDD